MTMHRSLLLVVVLTGPIAAGDPKPASKLRQALDATGDVVLEDQSLIGLADYFKGKLKAEVRFDNAALAAAGIDANAPYYTVKLRGGKVRDGLSAALAQSNLSHAIVGGSLFIGFEADAIARQMRQRVSVDGEAATLAAVLKSLADETGANVTLDPRETEKRAIPTVKLKLDDVPLETAVRLLAEVGGLSAVRMNNVLFVTTEERAARLATVADPPVPAAAAPAAPAFPAVPFGLGGLLKPPGGGR